MAEAETELKPRAAALAQVLAAMPGAAGAAGPGPARGVTIFKVMGKMFAILSGRKAEWVILKCDPVLADDLRGRYTAVGHKSHLDPRFWISIDLDGDVPAAEIERLSAHSYDQVC